MEALASLEFVYKSKTYYALVRRKPLHADGTSHVTVLDSSLHKQLDGHDVWIVDETGCLNCNRSSTTEETNAILETIREAFSRRTQKKEA